jgi:hypothetical protein
MMRWAIRSWTLSGAVGELLAAIPRQRNSLQTVFFNAVIGSADVPELPLPPRGAAASAVMPVSAIAFACSAIAVKP